MAFAVLFFIIAFLIVLNVRGAFECVDGFCTLRPDFSSYNFMFIVGIALIVIFVILSSYFQQFFLIDGKVKEAKDKKRPKFSALFSKSPSLKGPKEVKEVREKKKKPVKERLKKPSPNLQTYEPKKKTVPVSAKKLAQDKALRTSDKQTEAIKKDALDKETTRKRRTIAHTKEDLSLIVAKRVNMSAEDARKFLDLTFDTIFKALENHQKVNIHKFGTFTTSQLKERKMQVPSKGGETTIPAHHVVRFKGSDVFENYLNNPTDQPPITVEHVIEDKLDEVASEAKMLPQSRLIENIVKEAELSEKEAKAFLKTMTRLMKESLAKKESVTLYGFGTFEVVEHKAKKMVIPSTEETREIASRNIVKFNPGKPLLEHFNKNH